MTSQYEQDPGLWLERTGLAWQRSALALAANAVLLFRAGLAGGPRLIGLPVAAVVAYGSFRAWRHGDRLYLRRIKGVVHPTERALTGLTALTVGTGLAALIMALWH